MAGVTPASMAPGWMQLRNIPGLGVVMVATILLVTGALVSNVVGRWWLRQLDKLFTNIPIFKSIYNKHSSWRLNKVVSMRRGPFGANLIPFLNIKNRSRRFPPPPPFQGFVFEAALYEQTYVFE